MVGKSGLQEGLSFSMFRLGRDGPYEWKYLAGNIGLRDIMLQIPLVLYLPELQYMGLLDFG